MPLNRPGIIWRKEAFILFHVLLSYALQLPAPSPSFGCWSPLITRKLSLAPVFCTSTRPRLSKSLGERFCACRSGQWYFLVDASSANQANTLFAACFLS